ncbi:hypothetical protein [Streptomyces hesseae]|uniref:Uncharacterized protein n=1 Tax=Streptomyces hesseae TaxID=3075519 RepID=A0ABU2SSJ4_9ACTN|nr:hypothetical protein [Streptomyces sp. DSM 40473]MDT0451963.1 hypothetical protein [Streptomyces sp. DSM 40473]
MSGTLASPPSRGLGVTPGLLCSVVVSTWVEDTAAGPVAFLLIGHPPARRQGETAESIEQQMLGLSAALGLTGSSEPMRHVGSRVILLGASGALLSITGAPYSLRLPPVGAEWSRMVGEGAPVCILLGLDPIPPYSDEKATQEHLSLWLSHDRIRMGATAGVDRQELAGLVP